MAITMTMNLTIDPLTSISAAPPTIAAVRPMDDAPMIVINDSNNEDASSGKRPLNEVAEAEAETASESPATKKQRRSKRVTFGSASVRTFSRVEPEEAPFVWYSASEFFHSRRCDAYWINFYTHCDDTYRQELIKVLGAACGKLAPTPEPLMVLSSSPARGLEREMTPCFRQRKKQVVGNVLQSQAALQAYKETNKTATNDHKSAEILARHYRKLALPAARFARLLAQGDAAAAADGNR